MDNITKLPPVNIESKQIPAKFSKSNFKSFLVEQSIQFDHVHLFGSQLFGCAKTTSDWDFYIADSSQEEKRKIKAQFDNALVDINLHPHEHFEFTDQLLPLMCSLTKQSYYFDPKCNLLDKANLSYSYFIKLVLKSAKNILKEIKKNNEVKRFYYACSTLQLALMIIQSSKNSKAPFEIDFGQIKELYEFREKNEIDVLKKNMKN